MNIFINLYNGWTVYEWILLGSSLSIIFILANLGTYLFTRNFKFLIPIAITFPIAGLLYTLLVFFSQFLAIPITHLFLIPIILISTLITVNWSTFITYYMKYRNSKKFSLDILVKEYRRDSIRNIVFLTVAMLAASIFLNNELIAIFLITYFVFGVSIIINTELVKRFIHD